MFAGLDSYNEDLSGWDVSSATTMDQMFEEAEAFNADLSGWDVSNVTDYQDFGTDSGLDPAHYPTFP